MAVELEIRDGAPWWMSPDVWTVPGSDPQGAPGMPTAGQPCYLWARVANNGTSSVTNATVRFYWADPSTGFDRNTANPVGVSYVNLVPGEAAAVLCLTPWSPVYVNQGHECILAEAFHETLDPLPLTPAFNVATDRHVGQRNLQIVFALKGFFHLPFTIVNPSRTARTFQLKVSQGQVKELRPLQPHLGRKLPEQEGKLLQAGFVSGLCPREEALEGVNPEGVSVEVPGRASVGQTLIGRLSGKAAVVHVAQYCERRPAGGLTLLVLPSPASTLSNPGPDAQGGTK